MLRLFRAIKSDQNVPYKSYKEMSKKELCIIIRVALDNNDVDTLKAIIKDGFTVDTLPYPGRNQAYASFLLNCISLEKNLDSKVTNFLLRNTKGQLWPHYEWQPAKLRYGNDLLNEAFIRNDQSFLKHLWDCSYKTRIHDVESFKKYVSDYPLTETEVNSALCCLEFVIKKNHIKADDAEQLRNYLNSLNKQPQEKKPATPGM